MQTDAEIPPRAPVTPPGTQSDASPTVNDLERTPEPHLPDVTSSTADPETDVPSLLSRIHELETDRRNLTENTRTLASEKHLLEQKNMRLQRRFDNLERDQEALVVAEKRFRKRFLRTRNEGIRRLRRAVQEWSETKDQSGSLRELVVELLLRETPEEMIQHLLQFAMLTSYEAEDSQEKMENMEEEQQQLRQKKAKSDRLFTDIHFAARRTRVLVESKIEANAGVIGDLRAHAKTLSETVRFLIHVLRDHGIDLQQEQDQVDDSGDSASASAEGSGSSIREMISKFVSLNDCERQQIVTQSEAISGLEKRLGERDMEVEDLTRRLESLKDDRDSVVTERGALEKKVEMLIEDRDALQVSRDLLEEETKRMAGELQVNSEKEERLRAEKKQEVTSLTSLVSQRDEHILGLRQQLEGQLTERGALSKELQERLEEANSEKATLITSLRDLLKERDEQIQELRSGLDSSKEENARIASESKELQERIVSETSRFENLVSQRLQEIAELREEMASQVQAADTVKMQLSKTEETLERRKSEFVGSSAELEERCRSLQISLDDIGRKRENEVSELKDSLRQVKQDLDAKSNLCEERARRLRELEQKLSEDCIEKSTLESRVGMRNSQILALKEQLSEAQHLAKMNSKSSSELSCAQSELAGLRERLRAVRARMVKMVGPVTYEIGPNAPSCLDRRLDQITLSKRVELLHDETSELQDDTSSLLETVKLQSGSTEIPLEEVLPSLKPEVSDSFELLKMKDTDLVHSHVHVSEAEEKLRSLTSLSSSFEEPEDPRLSSDQSVDSSFEDFGSMDDLDGLDVSAANVNVGSPRKPVISEPNLEILKADDV